MNYKSIYNKKAISPLITIILLIIVSFVIVGLIVSWSKSFLNNSFEDTSLIGNFSVSDSGSFISSSSI